MGIVMYVMMMHTQFLSSLMFDLHYDTLILNTSKENIWALFSILLASETLLCSSLREKDMKRQRKKVAKFIGLLVYINKRKKNY